MLTGADEDPPRLFGTHAEARRIAAGLLARTLPRAEWTHEAHPAAVCVLLSGAPRNRSGRELPGNVSSYNAAVGGVNDSIRGYHETITQFWLANARTFLAADPTGNPVARITRFIAAPAGRRDAPLRHFSPECLFSVEARLGLVEPDTMRFPWNSHAAPAPQL